MDQLTMQTMGHFEWERCSHCWKAAGMHGNGVPIVKILKNACKWCCEERLLTTIFLQLLQLLLKWTSLHSAFWIQLSNSISLDSINQNSLIIQLISGAAKMLNYIHKNFLAHQNYTFVDFYALKCSRQHSPENNTFSMAAFEILNNFWAIPMKSSYIRPILHCMFIWDPAFPLFLFCKMTTDANQSQINHARSVIRRVRDI